MRLDGTVIFKFNGEFNICVTNMKWLFFVAISSRTFKTKRGNVGRSGRAYNLSRQIYIVSSSGMFVNNELTSNEHINSLLWLCVLAQSAKLKESLIVN